MPNPPREQKDYIDYIDEQYNSERLTAFMTTLTEMIGAKVLSISSRTMTPGRLRHLPDFRRRLQSSKGDTVVAHLDTSHVTVHTYPEYTRNQHSHLQSGYRYGHCVKLPPVHP
jgi:S-adenosylmethionine decarboxylase